MQPRPEQSANERPLCVDLDGSLIRTDLLIESLMILLRQNVLFAFLVPFWLLKGIAHLKTQIAARVEIDASLLPYSDDFLTFLRAEKARGRRLVLATASHLKFAQAVNAHLGLFDEIIATAGEENLSGTRKRKRLDEKFGPGNYDYAGNSYQDLAIWSEAKGIILVNPEPGLRKRAEALGHVMREFNEQPLRLKTYLKALRPHQWLKNTLIFVPLLMAQALEPASIAAAIWAFIAFGLCASSVYLLNDLIDLRDDRRHPTKRKRPLAAGTLPIQHALLLKPVLLISAFTIAAQLPLKFLLVLGIYYVTTLTYSFFLKRTLLFDVITLAGLYTLRIIAGSAALALPDSSWLLAFSVFLFFSLALVKRYVELADLVHDSDMPPPLSTRARGYMPADREALSQFGIASGLIAVLVLALYIDTLDDTLEVKMLYNRPEFLWLVCPLMLYLICRIWILARRGHLVDDPVLFAATDLRSLAVIVAGALMVLLAAI